MNRAPGTCGKTTERGTFVLLRVPKGQEKEFSAVKIFKETKVENFPYLLPIFATDSSSVNPNRINPKEPTSRHIIIKLLKTKNKENTLRTTRKK